MDLDEVKFICKAIMEVVVGALATLAAIIFVTSAMIYYGVTKPACEQYGRLTNSEISTQFFGAGCLVKFEGRWVDYDVAVAKKQEITVKQQ